MIWNLSQNLVGSSCVDTDPECPELKHINQHKNYRPYSLKIKKVGVKTGDEQETEWWWWSSGCSLFTVHSSFHWSVSWSKDDFQSYFYHLRINEYFLVFALYLPLLFTSSLSMWILSRWTLCIYINLAMYIDIVHKYLQLLEEASFHKRTKCDRNNCWSTRLLRSE